MDEFCHMQVENLLKEPGHKKFFLMKEGESHIKIKL